MTDCVECPRKDAEIADLRDRVDRQAAALGRAEPAVGWVCSSCRRCLSPLIGECVACRPAG